MAGRGGRRKIMARILVIDDEEAIREVLEVMLTGEGYEVIEAADGRDGMKRFQENPFDLVITDLIMPEKEGIETIIDLRRHYPQVKVIAVSGGGIVPGADYLTVAQAVGAHRVFEKPFVVADLLKAVKDLLT